MERASRIIPDDLAGDPDHRPPQILGTVARHPHLLESMLKFSTALANGVLPRRASEILALRTAWNCRSDFEWGHHTRYGLEAGLAEAEIERLAGGAPEPGWNAEESVLIRAADELHKTQDLSDETWLALAETWDEPQLVEIPFVVGQYTMLSMVAKSTGVPVDEALARFPDRRPSAP
ncbi:MAG: carboxymuconolactone decarboxylase [Deltaproteobacteria bacterium]|nr:carboxymuconolactone decarboxylase [Deltaproteobacteria bacterium]